MPTGGVLINRVIADLPKIISATYFIVKKNPKQQRKFCSYFKFPLVHLPTLLLEIRGCKDACSRRLGDGQAGWGAEQKHST